VIVIWIGRIRHHRCGRRALGRITQLEFETVERAALEAERLQPNEATKPTAVLFARDIHREE